jgi:PAS domain S-box-containing protein
MSNSPTISPPRASPFFVNAEIVPPGRGDLTLSGFVAAASVAVVLVCAAYWLSLQQSRAAEWVNHTHEVLTTIARTRTALVDIQNGHRGFTISGREEDLEPYRSGRAAIAEQTTRLRALLADNPAQQQRVTDLENGLAARLASAAQLIDARRHGGFDAAKTIVDSGLPKEEMENLRGVLNSLQSNEEQVLQERLIDHEQRVRWFWAGMTAVVVLLVAALALLYVQIRRHRAAQQALLESETRFRLMTSSVIEYAIIMLDLQGRVRTWNAGAQRITGYLAEEMVVGPDYSCFFRAEDVRDEKPMRTLQTAAAEGRFAEEGWLARKDGSGFWASIVITPLRDPHGDLRGFCMIARDLTEHRRAAEMLRAEVRERIRVEEELQRLNRSLEALVQERTAELSSTNADLLNAKLGLRVLSSQLIAAQEQERRDIARELDGTGQSLAVIRMHLTDVMRGKDGATALMPDCIAVADAAIAHVRAMVMNLRPTMLDDLGLAEALEWALEERAKAAGWKAAIDTGDVQGHLPSDIRTACFRIAQEALANAERHAGASEVKLQLKFVGSDLELTVSDNGTGFDLERYCATEERKEHVGLVTMAERASLLGGSLEIDTARGRGTRIRASLPIPANAKVAEPLGAGSAGA